MINDAHACMVFIYQRHHNVTYVCCHVRVYVYFTVTCMCVHVCVHVGITANINTGLYELSSETIFHVIYYVKITMIFSCRIIFISTSSQQRARFFYGYIRWNSKIIL